MHSFYKTFTLIKLFTELMISQFIHFFIFINCMLIFCIEFVERIKSTYLYIE